jgi:hypothetical protein
MPTHFVKLADKHRQAISNDAGKTAPSVATPPKDSAFRADGPRHANGHKVGKPTPRVAKTYVATPSQEAIFGTDIPRDAIGHAIGKPTPSVATAIIATPPKNAIFRAGEPRHAIGNDAGKPTPTPKCK